MHSDGQNDTHIYTVRETFRQTEGRHTETSIFVTHSGSPFQKVRHISRTLRFLGGLAQKPGQKPPLQILSPLFGGFCLGGFVKESFVCKVLSGVYFARSPFCQNTSVTTES